LPFFIYYTSLKKSESGGKGPGGGIGGAGGLVELSNVSINIFILTNRSVYCT